MKNFQQSKKRVFDYSLLQFPSTEKRRSGKSSASFSSSSTAVSHSSPMPIKTEKPDIAPIAESFRTLVDQILDAPENALPNSVPIEVKQEIGETAKTISSLLSRLRSPELGHETRHADLVRQSYALAAKSLKEALFSHLISEESTLDTNALIDLVNPGLDSLSRIGFGSPELNDAVRVLIELRFELSEAEKKRGIDGLGGEVRVEETAARSSEAFEAFERAKASLVGARKSVLEKRDLMRKLEEEVIEGDRAVGVLEREVLQAGTVFSGALAEKQLAEKRFEEEKGIARRIGEAKDGIEKKKEELSSILLG